MNSELTDFRPLAGLNGYELEEIWLEQPLSVIYRGRRKIDSLRVLIRLPKNSHLVGEWEKLFRRDLRIAQQLNSPYAVRPFAFELTDRGPALFYGDEGASSLKEVIAQSSPDIETALRIGTKIAEAVGALHKERVCSLQFKSNHHLVQ